MSTVLEVFALLFVVTFVVLVVMGAAVGLFLALCQWMSERW